MKQLSLVFSLCVLSMFVRAEDIKLHPTPQKIEVSTSKIDLSQGINYALYPKEDLAISNFIQQEKLGKQNIKGLKLSVGTRTDKAFKKYSKTIPNKADGYLIKITAKEIIVAGNDSRGAFYGLQTLSQLINQNKLTTELEIVDYPDIAVRGIVEGFYGTPWSFEARLDQIEFYGKNKLNTYIYGPKDDPYHSSPNWRKPYPEKEAGQIRQLVQKANENKVNFVWAIHPGQDIKWTDEDRDLLIQKFEKMYDLGVRSFAVFFDDIWGEGAKAEKQTELLNYIDNNFIQKKESVNPLIMCPTEYNQLWSDLKTGYLPTLGSKLNPTIEIMWTGASVCCEIKEKDIDWINGHINRKAYIWWNFPVSDYVQDHLLMGRVYGNDTTIENKVSAFVANPMERAEASKIALYGIANYTWNIKAFNSDREWNDAIAMLMPKDKDALKVFASHSSDLGENGHKFRREESVSLKSEIDKFSTNRKDKQAELAIRQELKNIREAMDILLVSEDNPALLSEIRPWIVQLKNISELGEATFALSQSLDQQDKTAFIENYRHLSALRKMNYNNDQTYNQNPSQPGVKVGSLVLSPFIESLSTNIIERGNVSFALNLDAQGAYSPYGIKTNMPQFENKALRKKGKGIIIPPVLEVVKWDNENYLEIDLKSSQKIKNIEIDLGVKDLANWLTIETSADGTEWKNVSFEKDGTIDINQTEILRIRFINKKSLQEVSFKKLQINLK